MKKMVLLVILVAQLFSSICDDKLFDFSCSSDSGQTTKSILNNLVIDECGMNVVYRDDKAKKELEKQVGDLKISNYSLKDFLDLLLSDNNLFYEIRGDKVFISYLKTKTFRVDYMLSDRTGSSTFKASSTENGDNNSVDTSYEFKFWDSFATNLEKVLNTEEDSFKAAPPVIDKNSGLITITATKKQLERVDQYIKDLNRRLHKQVIVDVHIYSVELAKNNATGINWSNFSLGLNQANIPLTAANMVGKTSVFKNTNFSISGLVNFLATNGNVNSISNPKIATLNNQKAIISVGDNVNYRYPTKVVLDQNGNPQTEYATENKFVGILLDITPEISKDNSIILRINPTVSTFRDETQLVDPNRQLPPDTTENKMSTIVKIRDGQTLVLGGLITKKNSFSENGVPILKEIPIIKYLFSYKAQISNKKELVFVVTPHVIDPYKKRTLKDLGFSK